MGEHRTTTQPPGLALIAVLVALSLLLALTGPFLLSMGHGDTVSIELADQKHVELVSASARDIVLHRASRTHDSIDEHSSSDDASEFPSSLELPEDFAKLTESESGRHSISAETEDLQRRINLNTASPLLLANLLGLSTRLTEEHPDDAEKITVRDASGFADEGYLMIGRELIGYGAIEENAFVDIQRGLLSGRGYTPAKDHVLPRDGLVLDFRVVLAVTHSFYHQGDDRRDQRIPLSSVEEIARIEGLGFGGFTADEMDVLRKHCTVGSVREVEADFGQPQRVFEPVEVGATPWQGRVLRVRSASDLGGGTVLRIRSLDGEHVEYALCWGASEVGRGSVNLPTPWALHLVRPVARPFAQIDTVVEALLPHAINVNTASEEVLTAVVQGVRSGSRSRPHGDSGNRVFSRSDAEKVATQLHALRGEHQRAEVLSDGIFAGAEPRPFESFEDLAVRFFKPNLLGTDPAERGRWLRLYRTFRIGRPGDLEMGTAPLTFTSAPVVSYRAAAMRTRGGKTVARRERSGTAVAMPGMGLDLVLSTQRDFERRFRIDRRAPFYTTHPINMGSWVPFDPGTNPPSRAVAHVLPMAMPDLGFGEPRFPSNDGNADVFTPAPSHTPFSYSQNRVLAAEESMWTSYHPEGRDTAQEGPYEMRNSGPRAGGGEPPVPPRTGPRAHQPSFPYTVGGGLVGPHAVSFWFRPRDSNDQMLFDLSEDERDRNRITIKIEENELVFEVMDEAGLDDDIAAIQRVRTSPERTAGTWRVPLIDIDLQSDTWYHVNLSAMGNRPGQMTLLVDGVPRNGPELRTYLSKPIPSYIPPSTPGPFWQNTTKYLDIMVEDTEGFPDRGVLRIGLELFEYTSKTAGSFSCQFGRGDPVNNTVGGRVARMRLQEYVPRIPTNASTGRPLVNIEEITGGANILVAPPHEAGSSVELYGYSVPVYRDFTVQVGSGTLQSALGPFAVARVINDKTPIGIPLPMGGEFPLGHGLDADEVVDIDLGDPVAMADPQPATEPIYTAFSTSGGYALLMQVYIDWGAGEVPGQGNSEVVGGIELIRYGARSGARLTGIQRGVKLGSSQTISWRRQPVFDGTSRKFVAQWLPSRTVMGEPLEEFPQWLAYVVPISIPVQGGAMDPTILGRSEFVQIYPRGGDEADTEWVRYDYLEGNSLMRTDAQSWLRTWRDLTSEQRRGTTEGYNEEVTVENEPSRTPYPEVNQEGVGYIGYTEQVEVDFPGIQVARRALHFRGDTLTGTTSHGFSQGALVLPVHRFELDWGNYGAISGRTGRNDRVALVGGTDEAGTSRPPTEWQTVNWSFRRFSVDAPPQGAAGGSSIRTTNAEKLGAHYCQFVAFQDQVTQLFVGPAQRNFQQDVRRVDRLIKFPSGELPAAAPEDGVFGSSPQKDVADFRGLLDELAVVQRLATPVLLDEPFADKAGEFVVRKDMLVTPQGDLIVSGADYTANYPQEGGLVLIGGELIAYESRQGTNPAQSRFKIAQNGRGLLDPERRAYHHDEGEMVYFLEHVPTAILSSGLSASGAEIVVNDIGNLPLHGGTLLVGGTELLHYCWSTGRQLMEMPVWFDPENPNRRGRGLLRGRFGTTPVSASAGEPVIWFPFRYWDRHHERAVDPELAHFQVSWSLAPVYFKSLYWQEEEVDALVDTQCLVRIDGQGSFANDPAKQAGLFLFKDGHPNQRPNPMLWQGSRLEARFMNVYKPGAFDPATFLSHAWKKAGKVRSVVIDYEGESRILSERITAR